MKIKVLLADDSDVMRSAIRRTLEEEPRIQVVGEAPSFAKTVQMIADLKPDVLLLDLHLAENRDFAPEFVKAQLATVRNVVAISFSNDHEAQDLAKRYGVVALLDKTTLYTEIIPAILHCEPKESRKPVMLSVLWAMNAVVVAAGSQKPVLRKAGRKRKHADLKRFT